MLLRAPVALHACARDISRLRMTRQDAAQCLSFLFCSVSAGDSHLACGVCMRYGDLLAGDVIRHLGFAPAAIRTALVSATRTGSDIVSLILSAPHRARRSYGTGHRWRRAELCRDGRFALSKHCALRARTYHQYRTAGEGTGRKGWSSCLPCPSLLTMHLLPLLCQAGSFNISIVLYTKTTCLVVA